MSIDNVLRDLRALETTATNVLSSLHAPRRPVIEAHKALSKDLEDEAIAGDQARSERLIAAGIPTELEWPEKKPSMEETKEDKKGLSVEDETPRSRFAKGFK